MPKLHKYVRKDGYYVLTSIRNEIYTFQLTARGIERLLKAGLQDGAQFRRAILFDLWSQGDAYTHGSRPGFIEPLAKGQLELDFINDPQPDTIFPGCSRCGSLDDLHIVEILGDKRSHIELFCIACREKRNERINASIPVPLVTRGILARLIELKGIDSLDENAAVYKDSLERAFIEKWNRLVEEKAKLKKGYQENLFNENGGQKKLIE